MLFRVSIADQFLFTVPRCDSGVSVWLMTARVPRRPNMNIGVILAPRCPETYRILIVYLVLHCARHARTAAWRWTADGRHPWRYCRHPRRPRTARQRALPVGATPARPAAEPGQTPIPDMASLPQTPRGPPRRKPASAARGGRWACVAPGGIDRRAGAPGPGQERHARHAARVRRPTGHATGPRPRLLYPLIRVAGSPRKIPSRLRDTCRRDNAGTAPRPRDGGGPGAPHALPFRSSHTPPDLHPGVPTLADRAGCRTLTPVYDSTCTTVRRIGHTALLQHSALNQPAATGAHDDDNRTFDQSPR